MNIVSWNVNSIKARLPHVLRYLRESAPDVLMIQELKGLDFPAPEFEALGYHTAAVGQKAYNGVAVISKTPIKTVMEKLPGDEADEQARYLEFETGGLRLVNIYAPNGNPLGTEKFPYKLGWLDRLYRRLRDLREASIPFAIGGDFNIIPDEKDCRDPNAWTGDALFQPESRAHFRALINLGLTDAFRIYDARPGQYTFWDYQAGAWQKNNGIRIDHFLLSPELTDRIKSCRIDKNPRSWDQPSDHTPIVIEVAA
jgi:exodeoxyribonuclease III